MMKFDIVTGCVSISAFASLVRTPVGIANFTAGKKICTITARIKKDKAITKKNKKRHDEMVLLAETELNIIEVLVSKALIDSYISHDEFVLINNIVKEYDDLKEEINDLKTSSVN